MGGVDGDTQGRGNPDGLIALAGLVRTTVRYSLKVRSLPHSTPLFS